MKVLMITGDKNIFKEGTNAHERFLLQQSQVDELQVVYWGPDKLRIPWAKGFDIVTTQDPVWRGIVGLISARLSGAKLQVQVHTELFSPNVPNWVRLIAKYVLNRADSIRVVSSKLKDQLFSYDLKAPIHVLPIYIDLEPFRHILRNKQARPTILWIGRFEIEKDPSLAIKVIKQVKEEIPNVEMIMVGEGSMSSDLVAEAKNNPIQVPIEIQAWTQNIGLFLEKADVVLCTSLFESYGASIVEALAAGVPVVAPDVGVAKEAGANVVDRADLAKEVVRVLKSGQRGNLKLSLLTKERWATEWKKTL